MAKLEEIERRVAALEARLLGGAGLQPIWLTSARVDRLNYIDLLTRREGSDLPVLCLYAYRRVQPSSGMTGFGVASWTDVVTATVQVPQGGGVLLARAGWTFRDDASGSTQSAFSVRLTLNGTTKDSGGFTLEADRQRATGASLLICDVSAGEASVALQIYRTGGDRKVNSVPYRTVLWYALFI